MVEIGVSAFLKTPLQDTSPEARICPVLVAGSEAAVVAAGLTYFSPNLRIPFIALDHIEADTEQVQHGYAGLQLREQHRVFRFCSALRSSNKSELRSVSVADGDQ